MTHDTRLDFEFLIEYYAELPSTNTLALRYAREGLAEGRVIVADYQTAGRGKPGKKWLSPPGKNLLFSVLFRPPLTASQAPMTTQIAARAIARVLSTEYGIQPVFKRPNDLLVSGKKICGILTESVSNASGKIEAVVIGIGLNVNTLSKDTLKTAISIREKTGKNADRDLLLEKILNQLKKDISPLYAAPV